MARPAILWLTDFDSTEALSPASQRVADRNLRVLSFDDPNVMTLDPDQFALIVLNTADPQQATIARAVLGPRARRSSFMNLVGPATVDVVTATCHAADALAARRHKDAFFAQVVHDFKSPLGVIVGFTDLLRQQVGMTAEARHYVDCIARNARKLADFSDDLLAIAKHDAGVFSIKKRQVKLVDEIENVLREHMLHSRAKRLDFSVRFAGPVPEMVETDPLRLGQILSNLVANAVKFTDNGRIEVSVSMHGDVLEINVADTGPGIPLEQRDRIFGSYEQGDESVADRYGGTGLGLTLARGLAQRMDGDVTLKASVVGMGSVFSLKIRVTVPNSVAYIEDANVCFRHFNQGPQGGVSPTDGAL